ncbi:HPP family protein [Ammoniphilus oxalaticus]|uniref:HPP family protein n=1 Tax=Ammoniphilus oxalaticus TaxID=66863 RepID=UPI001B87B104|nr:HPP family protein [Ammoniphilus oxalaticus]
METLKKLTVEEEVTRPDPYLLKMRGGNRPRFQRAHYTDYLVTALGSFVGLALVAIINYIYNVPLLAPSFGATAVLVYGACHAPMSQPRNVVGGHLISAITGVSVYQAFGLHWWTIALGVSLAILFMSLTYTLHPPGGATAFIAVYTEQSFSFVLSPIGLGALVLVAVAVIVNNISSQRKYPEFWF